MSHLFIAHSFPLFDSHCTSTILGNKFMCGVLLPHRDSRSEITVHKCDEKSIILFFFIFFFYLIYLILDVHTVLQHSRFPVCFCHKIPGYLPGFVHVQKVILQVIVQTILAPKGRHQRHSKFAAVQNLQKIVSI